MKKIIVILVVIFGLSLGVTIINLFKPNPEIITEKKKDFLILTNAPKGIETIIKKSCYDCHSNNTVYPTYAKIFPVSLLINHHIKEGKEHINFSLWETYNNESKKHILEEAIEEIENNKMPMSSYTLIHEDAKLSDSQKKILLKWLKMQIEKI